MCRRRVPLWQDRPRHHHLQRGHLPVHENVHRPPDRAQLPEEAHRSHRERFLGSTRREDHEEDARRPEGHRLVQEHRQDPLLHERRERGSDGRSGRRTDHGLPGAPRRDGPQERLHRALQDRLRPLCRHHERWQEGQRPDRQHGHPGHRRPEPHRGLHQQEELFPRHRQTDGHHERQLPDGRDSVQHLQAVRLPVRPRCRQVRRHGRPAPYR